MLIKFNDSVVHIKDLEYGTVVQKLTWVEGNHTPDERGFGHITGFDYNSKNDLLLVVKFSDREVMIHPTNLNFKIV